MKILGLDPGPTATGFAFVDASAGQIERVLASGHSANSQIRAMLQQTPADVVALEMIASYGMPVGKDTFETCVWIGRFEETMDRRNTVFQLRFTRPEVMQALCHSSRAKASNVRQALIDLIGPVGTKKAPGPLYGVTGHAWAALGIAVLAARVFYGR